MCSTGAGCDILAVEADQASVDAAWDYKSGVARILSPHCGEPEQMQGVEEAFSGRGGDPPAGFQRLAKLGLPSGVGLLQGLLHAGGSVADHRRKTFKSQREGLDGIPAFPFGKRRLLGLQIGKQPGDALLVERNQVEFAVACLARRRAKALQGVGKRLLQGVMRWLVRLVDGASGEDLQLVDLEGASLKRGLGEMAAAQLRGDVRGQGKDGLGDDPWADAYWSVAPGALPVQDAFAQSGYP